MRFRSRMAFWLFSGEDQKSGSAICSSNLASWRCLAGASKIAPHGKSLLAEREVHSFQFFDGHGSIPYYQSRSRSSALYAPDSRPTVEVGVKRQNRLNSMAFHQRDVERVSRRHPRGVLAYLGRAQDVRFLDGENFVNNIQQALQRWPNRFAPVYGCVPMENLLQNLGAGHKALPGGGHALEQRLSIRFVGVRRSDEIHGNIRVDVNQLR
jgi:hypothetical protein